MKVSVGKSIYNLTKYDREHFIDGAVIEAPSTGR